MFGIPRKMIVSRGFTEQTPSVLTIIILKGAELVHKIQMGLFPAHQFPHTWLSTGAIIFRPPELRLMTYMGITAKRPFPGLNTLDNTLMRREPLDFTEVGLVGMEKIQ